MARHAGLLSLLAPVIAFGLFAATGFRFPFDVSVNISPVQLREPNFADGLRKGVDGICCCSHSQAVLQRFPAR